MQTPAVNQEEMELVKEEPADEVDPIDTELFPAVELIEGDNIRQEPPEGAQDDIEQGPPEGAQGDIVQGPPEGAQEVDPLGQPNVMLPAGIQLLGQERVRELNKQITNKKIKTPEQLTNYLSHLDNFIDREPGKTGRNHFYCLACGKAMKTRQHLRNHVEVHHVTGVKHICQHCETEAKTNASLQQHLAKLHGPK
jgi:hypothetical protein